MGSRALLVLCLAAGLMPVAGSAADGNSCKLVRIVEWPVRFVRNHVVVDGAINGRKVGITLDTGAQMSLILRSAAMRLDLPRREAPGYRAFGVGGESRMEIATVEEFKLGEAATRGLQLLVAGERDFGEDVDVLLGEDFLHRFDVEFDLAHRVVRLFQPRDCNGVSLAYWSKEAVGEVEIEPIDDARPRINLTVAINGLPIAAILDSGASTSVLTRQDAAALGVTPDSPGVVASQPSQGLGAKTVALWTGAFQTFAIGNESIPDVRIRFADLYKDATYSETGSRVAKKASRGQPMLLGADFLQAHRTLVAHSQHRLYFTYSGGPVFVTDAAIPRPVPRPDAAAGPATGGN
jgi:predicted aspartyl protease